jgi:hypothetical protein
MGVVILPPLPGKPWPKREPKPEPANPDARPFLALLATTGIYFP